MPIDAYERFCNYLEDIGFIYNNGHYEIGCQDIFDLRGYADDKLTFATIHSHTLIFMILSETYIVEGENGICTIDIVEDTSSETITLGTSILRQLSVIMDIKEDLIAYRFVDPLHEKGVDYPFYAARLSEKW